MDLSVGIGLVLLMIGMMDCDMIVGQVGKM